MVSRSLRLFTLLVLAAAYASPAAGFDFYDRGPYRAGVPRPSDVLGYQPGTYHTNYGNMERYVDVLVHAAPDRCRRVPYGRSYEFRSRALLVVSSPGNLARLEEIRAANRRLADPRRTPPAEAERLIRETPVTVWLNYSIHGDESASFEAMLQVAYQLAAGDDSVTRLILDRCVVLMNLAHNPDGHERFVTWVNAKGTGDPDPWALEQQDQQPWGIGGRTNHYQIDLNRDALGLSQRETREQAAAYRAWRAQVFADHHGQTAQFFFPPPAEAIHPALRGESFMRWMERFGRANAAAFDRYGWEYFVRDVFDFFYPGYWDDWPSLLGAIGMTYETDGGGNLALRRDDETVVTLLDGIARHFVASLATCETAARFREERLRDYVRFQREAIEEGRSGPVKGFVLMPGADTQRAARLVENLLAAGVEVKWVPRAFRSGAARPVLWDAPVVAKAKADAEAKRSGAGGGKAAAAPTEGDAPLVAPHAPEPPVAARSFPAGCYVVDLAQPAGRLARAMLERQAALDSGFVRLQLEKFERNRKRGRNVAKERYDFYDVTAWSLPIAYGVETYALRDEAPAGGVELAVPESPLPAEEPDAEVLPDSLATGIPVTARTSRGGPLELRAADGTVAVDLRGGVVDGPARTAYVWSCESDGGVRLALRLLQEDFKVAVAKRPLRAAGRDFPRGSFVARVERNPATLHERIAGLAAASAVKVQAVQSAYTDRGDTGVGSETVVSLKRPRIAVVADDPASPSSFGSIWFLLERVMGERFTALPLAALSMADLSRYNVIVFPDGNARRYSDRLGKRGVDRLSDWIRRGGALVCLADAAEFPTLEGVKLSSSRLVGDGSRLGGREWLPGAYGGEPGLAAADTAKADVRKRSPEPVPGAICRATLDLHHFLTYGYSRSSLPVLVDTRRFFKPSKDGANVAMFDRPPLLVSGFIWPDTEDQLDGTAWLIDEPTGQGHVVMIAGDPNFRLFWPGTSRVFLNAVMLAPTLD
jgi:hypothetical protein